MMIKMFKRVVSTLLVAGAAWANVETSTHVHPKAEPSERTQASLQSNMPRFCEIEIINDSPHRVYVNGVFDDGEPLDSFYIYGYESPHYIDLYYYGYCHYGMDLYIESRRGYRLYSGYTPQSSTIYISASPYLTKQPIVTVKSN